MATKPEWKIESVTSGYGSEWINMVRTDPEKSTFAKKNAHISREQIRAILSEMGLQKICDFAGIEIQPLIARELEN